jgi:hypothetical protein
LQTRPTGNQPRQRGILLLTAVIFFVTGGFNLLLGEWLRAAFFLAGGFVFLKSREIDRWPKAARYLVIVVFAALSVAMFVRLIFDAKALK